MAWHKLGYGAFLGLLVVTLLTGEPDRLTRRGHACFGCGGACFGGGGLGANGVMVDASGVLKRHQIDDPTGQLHKQRAAAARAALNPKIAKASKLRKVSLTRLEAAVKALADKNQPPTDDMLNLAGLTRLKYLFYYPETKDIVLAGPAEAWARDLTGRALGIESSRPTLQLEDMVVALRAFAPNGKKTNVILCSIDPTQEGLAKMQQFLRQVGSHATPGDTEGIVTGLRTALGMQNIRVAGVPANSHFAQVLIEADYRMKLIGIGVEKPPIKLASWVDKAKPAQHRNALQRWYFVPDYKCVRVTPDETGMELVGDTVRLVGEDQIVAGDGNRSVTGKTDKASQQFVEGFTKKYGDLAARIPVYGQLRNVIDMSVAAAFIQQHDLYNKSGWMMDTFGSEQTFAVETQNTPLQVESVVASVWKGNSLMTPIGGGVTVHPLKALETANMLSDGQAKVEDTREETFKNLPADQWWWD